MLDIFVPKGRFIPARHAVPGSSFAFYFGNSPQFWLNLQTHFDLEKATRESLEKIKSKVKPLQAA